MILFLSLRFTCFRFNHISYVASLSTCRYMSRSFISYSFFCGLFCLISRKNHRTCTTIGHVILLCSISSLRWHAFCCCYSRTLPKTVSIVAHSHWFTCASPSNVVTERHKRHHGTAGDSGGRVRGLTTDRRFMKRPRGLSLEGEENSLNDYKLCIL